MIFGVPSQMRVLDSRSYLRIIASTSAAVSVEASIARSIFLSFSMDRTPFLSGVIYRCFFEFGAATICAAAPRIPLRKLIPPSSP